ncbi:MAG TPA: hypothetical protein VKZ67_08230 [Natronosporangium sp.]|nr:hypothetical protein [Natronosporangium sp.]
MDNQRPAVVLRAGQDELAAFSLLEVLPLLDSLLFPLPLAELLLARESVR